MADTTPRVGRAAMEAMHAAHLALGEDPRLTFVAMTTAAALSGHMIERTPEQMHAMLDQVRDVALALMLQATETKQ